MASKFTTGQRVQITATGEAHGWLGTVQSIGRNDFPNACHVLLDQDPDQQSARFDDDELAPA